MREWGLCRFVSLHKDEGEKVLNPDEILELPMDMDELQRLIQEFNEGILKFADTHISLMARHIRCRKRRKNKYKIQFV